VKARLFHAAKVDGFKFEREIEIQCGADGSIELTALQSVFGSPEKYAVRRHYIFIFIPSNLLIQVINPINFRPVYAPLERIEAEDVLEFKKKEGFLRVVRVSSSR